MITRSERLNKFRNRAVIDKENKNPINKLAKIPFFFFSKKWLTIFKFPISGITDKLETIIHYSYCRITHAQSSLLLSKEVQFGQEVERWCSSIRLLDEWTYIDEPDQRLAYLRWLRPLEHLLRTMRIYHFRLGEAAA